jgi:hypothetical protein
MNIRSLPAGSATPSGRIDDFHVEQAAGCLPEAHRANALFWIGHYLETHVRAVDERCGHHPTIKGEASAISKALATLMLAMDAAGAETVDTMAIAHGKTISPDLGGGAVEAAEKFEIDWQDCRDFMRAMERAAGRVSSELPSQERADHMIDLVGRLGGIWRNATGKKPTRNENKINGENPTAFQEFMALVKQSLPQGERYTFGMEAAIRSVTRKR